MSADTAQEAGPSTSGVLPPLEKEGQPQIEDEVRARIVERLTGSSTAYLHLTEDESDHEEPAPAPGKCRIPRISCMLRTIDTTMVRSVIWPHEVVYSPTAQPIA